MTRGQKNSLQLDLVLVGDQFLALGKVSTGALFIHFPAQLAFDFLNRLLETFGYSMPFQRFIVETCVLGGENDESNDSDIASTLLHVVVQPRQGLDEDVASLVSELVSPRGEEQKSLVKVKVDVTMEVAVDELHDLLLVHLMKILEFVIHSLHIEAVRSYHVGFPLDQMLGLLTRNVTEDTRDEDPDGQHKVSINEPDSSEDMGKVSSSSLQTISVVNLPLPRLHVHVKVLQIQNVAINSIDSNYGELLTWR